MRSRLHRDGRPHASRPDGVVDRSLHDAVDVAEVPAEHSQYDHDSHEDEAEDDGVLDERLAVFDAETPGSDLE